MFDIARYYTDLQPYYDRFWSRHGMHHGFWYDDTKSIDEAVLNTNQEIGELLQINLGDRVLDAGCGVGAVSYYLAEYFGADVTGVNITQHQISEAINDLRVWRLGSGKVEFVKADYTNTHLPKGSFDAIFGIESVCHAKRKIDFMHEAYRLLKPGGRLAVCDGFLMHPLLPEEKENYRTICRCWQLPGLETLHDFEHDLRSAGFDAIVYHDRFDEIQKSIERAHRIGVMGYWPFSFLQRVGMVSHRVKEHLTVMKIQRKAFETYLTYGIFTAMKKEPSSLLSHNV